MRVRQSDPAKQRRLYHLSSFYTYLTFLCVMVCFDHLLQHQVVAQTKPMSDDELMTYCLRTEGDVEQGRAIFLRETLACSQCHSTDGRRNRLGPDLSTVGDKFGRREIIHSIMQPSARIADGYEQSVLQTTSGRVVVGLIKNVTNDMFELVSGGDSSVYVLRSDVDDLQALAVSIMPQGVHQALSPKEMNDLIEYLVSLKQPENELRLARGMPREIPELRHPVTFTPLMAEAQKFDQPVWMVAVPETDSHFLVIEHQLKKIWYMEVGESSEGIRKSEFLDLGPAEPSMGRLSCLAFHPQFVENRRYYTYDRVNVGERIDVVIEERVASADGREDSGIASREVLRVPQSTLVHYGGWLGFGSDKMLYITFGDSGPQEDPLGNAQNRSLLLGKIIRIDVDRREGGKQYGVPPDNPFVGHETIPGEVWAMGFRAPWRCCFDPVTNEFWVGDVGQDRYEEVNLVRKGENFGWNVFEGFVPFSTQYRREADTYVPPVFAYARRYGPSITGGYVYRADADSPFYGRYICGDYESRRLFAITHSDRELNECRQIGIAPQRIVSFAEDSRRRLYVVGYEGMLYRIDFGSADLDSVR